MIDPPAASTPRPIAVSAQSAAALVGLSRRAFEQLAAAGKTPRAYSPGGLRRKLWRVADLEFWSRLGFPKRVDFERQLAADEGGR